MDKLLEDIYRVGSGGGSIASESSTDQTNWSDGGGGGGRPTINSSKRLSRKSNIFHTSEPKLYGNGVKSIIGKIVV